MGKAILDKHTLILVMGVASSGKSTISREILKRISAEGARIPTGRSLENIFFLYLYYEFATRYQSLRSIGATRDGPAASPAAAR